MTVSAPSETPPTADDYEVVPPDISHIEIDDGAPVDNPYSEKQMRLLTEPLYASWEGPPPRDEDGAAPRQFLAAANVGCFATPRESSWGTLRTRIALRPHALSEKFSAHAPVLHPSCRDRIRRGVLGRGSARWRRL